MTPDQILKEGHRMRQRMRADAINVHGIGQYVRLNFDRISRLYELFDRRWAPVVALLTKAGLKRHDGLPLDTTPCALRKAFHDEKNRRARLARQQAMLGESECRAMHAAPRPSVQPLATNVEPPAEVQMAPDLASIFTEVSSDLGRANVTRNPQPWHIAREEILRETGGAPESAGANTHVHFHVSE